MQSLKPVIQHIAPTLSSAMGGPFVGVATKFITDKLVPSDSPEGSTTEEVIEGLLRDPANLKKVKEAELEFEQAMNKLDVDVFKMEAADAHRLSSSNRDNRYQILISIAFITAYFVMILVILAVEVSDTYNMRKGENTFMGELKVLFGVLTAGVGQILSFWFGGTKDK